MANKTLGTRQKLTFRVELPQNTLKPRNPVVAPAMLRAAGPHQKSPSAKRQLQKRLMQKNLDEPEQ